MSHTLMSHTLKKGHIHLQHHEQVILSGDIHGDLFAFLTILGSKELANCITFERTSRLWAQAAKCHQSDDIKLREGVPLGEEALKNIAWKGGTSVVVFLGDVLDNNRIQPETYGRCAMSGTQFQILDIMVDLKKQARKRGGDVIWVLGNHDVWNAQTSGNCRRYNAHRQTCTNTKLCTKNTDAYDVCSGQHGYSQQHVENVKAYMRKMEAVALVRIEHTSNQGYTTSVLGLHGGMTHIGKLQTVLTRANIDELRAGETQDNIRRINQLFVAALGIDKKRNINKDAENAIAYPYTVQYLPTWCRPSVQDNSDDLRLFFGTAKMVKAHDLQGQANCNVGGKTTAPSHRRGDGPLFQDGELCRIDVGMSRAFEYAPERKGREKQFQCLRLRGSKDGIHRKILTQTEYLKKNMDYEKHYEIIR